VSKHICPVCGYGMDDPPTDFNICPSCGTEFGNHDVNSSLEQLRAAWIRNGLGWWSQHDAQPEHWDPFMQVSVLLGGAFIWEKMLTVSNANRAPKGSGISSMFANPAGQYASVTKGLR